MTFTEPCLAAPLLDPSVEHTDETVYAAMEQLRYPVLATLKRDGIRGLRLNGTVLSRRLKPIPNKLICSRGTIMPGGFDVELFNPALDYNTIQSIVMSKQHPLWGSVEYHVLDWFMPDRPDATYLERLDAVNQWRVDAQPEHVKFDYPKWCDTPDALFAFEKMCIEQLGEGICFRTPGSPYKMGRSTLTEQYLVKLSRFSRDEATVIGFNEQLENCNPDKWNKVGKMDRSHCIDQLVGKGILGAFIVRNTAGQEFTIGTGVGLTNKWRRDIWLRKEDYMGKTMTYKCKQHGQKVLPRSPVFVGWRNQGE